MIILAGDIGGTNSRLAIFDEKLNKLHEKVTQNAGRSSLADVVHEFLSSIPKFDIEKAAFGVAGPVAEGKVVVTNLSWKLDEETLARELNVPVVGLINDLVAHAEGIEVLRPDQFVTLRAGTPIRGAGRAIIAAGTGLGEGGLFFDSKLNSYRAFASEGGHSDFGPRNETEDALLRFLRAKHPNPCYEHVLSGPGLKNIYDFFAASGQFKKEELIASETIKPANITEAALNGSSRCAVAAMELFVSIYGAESGNLTLKVLATNGLYIGGGIAPRIINFLKSPTFLESFNAHSIPKIHQVLSQVPIHVITYDLGGLYGAANYARRL
jgi:glucokinase